MPGWWGGSLLRGGGWFSSQGLGVVFFSGGVEGWVYLARGRDPSYISAPMLDISINVIEVLHLCYV